MQNSALNAAPFSLNGQEIAKPSSARENFGFNIGGPLRIPKLVNWQRANIYLNYSGNRARSARDSVATVPTQAERDGDFSSAVVSSYPVTIYDPTTHNPFPGNFIPTSRLNPASVALLQYFPQPTFNGAIQNYSIAPSTPTSSNSISLRTVMPLPTNHDSINFNVQYQGNDSLAEQLFGFQDTTSGYGLSATTGWSHSFKPRFNNNASLAFSRNISKGTPYFAYKTNVAAELGITGTDQDAARLRTAESLVHQLRRPDRWLRFGQSQPDHQFHRHHHLRHPPQAQSDVRLRLSPHAAESLSYANSRGSFSFSGLLTSGFDADGQPLAHTGYDFADFLLGYPQSSSLRIGNSNNYFRGWAINGTRRTISRLAPASPSTSGCATSTSRLTPNCTATSPISTSTPPSRRSRWSRPATPGPTPARTRRAWSIPIRTTTPRASASPGGLRQKQAASSAAATASSTAARPTARSPATHGRAAALRHHGVAQHQHARSAHPPERLPARRPPDHHQHLRHRPELQAGLRADLDASRVQQTLPHELLIELEYIGTKGTGLDVHVPNQAPPGSPLTAQQRLNHRQRRGFTLPDRPRQFHLPRRPGPAHPPLLPRHVAARALHLLKVHRRRLQLHRRLGGTVVQNPSDLAPIAASPPSTSATTSRSPTCFPRPSASTASCATAAGKPKRSPVGR